MIQRMRERNITRTDILECIQEGEIIGQYDKDYPHPSCLVLGKSKKGKCNACCLCCWRRMVMAYNRLLSIRR
ncbi:DUF4258 domain-containing protein [Anaerocellum diazotrophicum]|uniref:DUF4258 domain-containing protein n=1 Tax=Caldicellulosiruptor diazotrophicus TaxID=2806205 RepID=UPI0027D999B4|nr:DUF4258 domain-containing protein [Caldicellulosiruptor diazotrophicus]